MAGKDKELESTEQEPAAPSKKIFFMAIVFLVFVLLFSGAGFFFYFQIKGQHQENLKDLEKFGYTVLPSETYNESKGELGTQQVPATFAEDKLSPTQKVIHGLMQDNEQLIAEKKELEIKVAELHERIKQLETYKKLNEHYAPLSIAEEVAAVEKQLKKILINTPEASRFSNLQIEAMSAASGHEYKKFVKSKQVILSEKERENFVIDYMPEFAFCVGNGIEIAANSPREERLATTFFHQQDPSILSKHLKSDLETVIRPCQMALYSRLSSYDAVP